MTERIKRVRTVEPMEYMSISFLANNEGEELRGTCAIRMSLGGRQRGLRNVFTRKTYTAVYQKLCTKLAIDFLQYRRVPDAWLLMKPDFNTLLATCKVIETTDDKGRKIFMPATKEVTE